MVDPYILQAREILAVECERRGCPASSAKDYREGDWDGYTSTIALVRALREHAEKQPTFEQRVEAMRRATKRSLLDAEALVDSYDAHLAEIMAPKADPLVGVLDGLDWCKEFNLLAVDLRKALAARGLKIVAEGDA